MLEVHYSLSSEQLTIIAIAVVLVGAVVFGMIWRTLKRAAYYSVEQEALRKEWQKQQEDAKKRFAEICKTINYQDGQDDCISFSDTKEESE